MNCPGYYVTLYGYGIAASEVAHQFSKRVICFVIFEQNSLLYRKIKEGFLKWYVKLRNQEVIKIGN